MKTKFVTVKFYRYPINYMEGKIIGRHVANLLPANGDHIYSEDVLMADFKPYYQATCDFIMHPYCSEN